MKSLSILLFILCLSSCAKFDWHNPYDPECPKELFTPSSPGASMEGNSVKLTWSQQNDDISGFALFRSAEGESISNLTQTQKSTTQYIDANFTPGKKYTYYVVAVAGTNKSDTVKAEIIPVIPVSISTGAITELAATSAKVSGNITNAGGGTVTSRGICWSTTPNPTISNNKTTEGTGAGIFTSTLANLVAATTYYARAYGENSRGVSYGTQVTFTTLGPPKLTTTAVSNITATAATSGGSIISDGGSPITAKGVVWSTSPNPTITLATKTDDGTGLGSFTSGLSNLTINTKYYVRAYATNNIGTSYGEELSFTSITPTPPILESLKTGLVAYYPFNGNANDESGNGNNGTVNGAALTTDRFENTNKAYSFSNNTISVQNNSSLSFSNVRPFSVSIWVNSIANNQFVHYIGLREPGTQTKFWQIYSLANVGGVSGLAFQTNENFEMLGTLALNASLPLNKWVNIIGTYEFGNWKLYLNGTLITSTTSTKVFDNNLNTVLTIGNSGNFQPFFGKLDDIRIYNRALTQEEITYLANN
jgi:Concanavalin A-like lectin/glucanases superfamily